MADALEILILLAPGTRARSLGDATRAMSLRWGSLGAAVTVALAQRRWITTRKPAGSSP